MRHECNPSAEDAAKLLNSAILEPVVNVSCCYLWGAMKRDNDAKGL